MALEKLRRMGEFFKIVGREAEIAADGARDLVDDLRQWAPGKAPAKINKADEIEADIKVYLISQREIILEIEVGEEFELKNKELGRSSSDLLLTDDERNALSLVAGFSAFTPGFFSPATYDPGAVEEAKNSIFRDIVNSRLFGEEEKIKRATAVKELYQAHNRRGRAFVPSYKKITIEQAERIWQNNGLEGKPLLGADPARGVNRDELFERINMVKTYPGLERVFNSKGLSVEKSRMLYEELLERTRQSRKTGPARASTPAVAPRSRRTKGNMLDFRTRREIRTSPLSTQRELQITALAHARGITYAAAENQLEQTEHLVQAADHTAAAKRIAGGQTIVTKTPAPGWQMAIAKILHLPEE